MAETRHVQLILEQLANLDALPKHRGNTFAQRCEARSRKNHRAELVRELKQALKYQKEAKENTDG